MAGSLLQPMSKDRSHADASILNPNRPWIGLIVGNSRLHWGRFVGTELVETWDTDHRAEAETDVYIDHPLRFASVVPAQTQFLRRVYPQAQEITLADIPLGNLYATFGIDRALALWGAGHRYHWPVLVIDAGTALTITGADDQGNLVGGAILPGVQLQFDSLGQGTAALPRLQAGQLQRNPIQPSAQPAWPERWARTTEEAIASGILHSLISSLRDYIADWRSHYPTSTILMTGGAGALLAAALEPPIELAATLGFWGLGVLGPPAESNVSSS